MDALLVSEHTLDGLQCISGVEAPQRSIHTSTHDPHVIPSTRSSHFSDREGACRIEMKLAL